MQIDVSSTKTEITTLFTLRRIDLKSASAFKCNFLVDLSPNGFGGEDVGYTFTFEGEREREREKVMERRGHGKRGGNGRTRFALIIRRHISGKCSPVVYEM